MSRPRVITGVDERGRPKATWADAPAEPPPYAFMEPALQPVVERRKATPEELAAARAREDEPRHLTVPTRDGPVGAYQPVRTHIPEAERLQASRQRGAERHVEVVSARRPSPAPAPPRAIEEEAVSKPPTNIPETIPAALDTFEALAEAAAQASEAWARRQAAEIAWDIAQEALEAALGEVDAILHPPPDHLPAQAIPLSDGSVMRAHSDGKPETIAVLRELGEAILAHPPEPLDRSSSRAGEGQRPGQAAARDRRAAAVMGAMERLGDDMDAVASELGMKKNAVAQIVKFARRRAEATA